MVEVLFISKILVSILVVVGLSAIAERVSPKVAGILSGYPLGTAISLFFIGIENGVDFATHASVFTLSGLTASLTLVFGYYHASRVTAHLSLPVSVFISVLASVSVFLSIGFGLSKLPLGLISGFVLCAVAIVVFTLLFRPIQNTLVTAKVRFTRWVLLVRSLAAAGMVLLITGVAEWAGSSLAGILAAFPITLFPFLVIMHLTYGAAQAHTVIKNYPLGIGALITYVISVSFAYPALGIGLGTLVSFGFATLYLMVFYFINQRLRDVKSLKVKRS
ncbi:hypothetical protein [Litoribacillus peritrichatus]|uniref:Uncharacterized protein n=1 Tax=Litoribacillus peritrichatus TaxID=718191 RepID=A0ABP7MTV4_9GAMM